MQSKNKAVPFGMGIGIPESQTLGALFLPAHATMGNKSTKNRTETIQLPPRILLLGVGRSGRCAFLRIVKHRYLSRYLMEQFGETNDGNFLPTTGGLQYRRGLAPLFFTALHKMLEEAVRKAQADGIVLPRNFPVIPKYLRPLSDWQLEIMQMLRDNSQISAWAKEFRDWDYSEAFYHFIFCHQENIVDFVPSESDLVHFRTFCFQHEDFGIEKGGHLFRYLSPPAPFSATTSYIFMDTDVVRTCNKPPLKRGRGGLTLSHERDAKGVWLLYPIKW